MEALLPKLTDTQLIILSAAAQRDGGEALPLPKSIKLQGGAINHVLNSLLNKSLLAEQPAGHDDTSWRESKDGQRLMLIITDAGRAAIGVATEMAAKKRPATPKASASKRRTRAKQQAAVHRSKRKAQQPEPRAGTKQSILIQLLSRRNGATIAEAVKATGWQPHSVRGAISGSLKKKLRLSITSAKVEARGRIYRIDPKH